MDKIEIKLNDYIVAFCQNETIAEYDSDDGAKMRKTSQKTEFREIAVIARHLEKYLAKVNSDPDRYVFNFELDSKYDDVLPNFLNIAIIKNCNIFAKALIEKTNVIKFSKEYDDGFKKIGVLALGSMEKTYMALKYNRHHNEIKLCIDRALAKLNEIHTK